MKRIVKATTIAAVGCALMLGSTGTAMADSSGAHAKGVAAKSPGVISGNVIQVPIGIPINLCGNTINVIGLLNPATGNQCINK
ncbi:chaplin [Streptomyces gobiensis]|uniref:chaplin n=1 Tax=Streptomyces gobiensis TaxID=2875706 RepID=UPI001E64BE61|nr:chaplin [Streptomyces gobiensis]UGY90541.1 chaplin [Streptomyces gobiensis]